MPCATHPELQEARLPVKNVCPSAPSCVTETGAQLPPKARCSEDGEAEPPGTKGTRHPAVPQAASRIPGRRGSLPTNLMAGSLGRKAQSHNAVFSSRTIFSSQEIGNSGVRSACPLKPRGVRVSAPGLSVRLLQARRLPPRSQHAVPTETAAGSPHGQELLGPMGFSVRGCPESQAVFAALCLCLLQSDAVPSVPVRPVLRNPGPSFCRRPSVGPPPRFFGRNLWTDRQTWCCVPSRSPGGPRAFHLRLDP